MSSFLKDQTTPFVSENEPPPGKTVSFKKKLRNQPSGNKTINRKRFFSGVSDEDWNDWKWHFKHRITSIDELAKFIPLTIEDQVQIRSVTVTYPLSITPYYLSLIESEVAEDPIRIQAVPSIQEITMGSIGREDPLEEKRDSVVPGLIHKYPDRVLMVLTDICPMLCRHCTRKREWRHGNWVRNQGQVMSMLAYIRKHKNIRDVIISGGDCLTLSTKRLEEVISALRRINHVEIIRIASRYPVVLPYRIDKELCDMLSEYGPIWFNTHFNHPRELTPDAAVAVDRLVRAGVPVNNQTVLLRGVNDSVETMTKLCQGLLRIKVRPYYLFQSEEVQGTEHLRTAVETGITIIDGMRGYTSGLAVPTFAIDLPYGGGKVTLQPDYVLSQSDGELLIRNYKHDLYRFRNPNPDTLPDNGTQHIDSPSVENTDNSVQYHPEGRAHPNQIIV